MIPIDPSAEKTYGESVSIIDTRRRTPAYPRHCRPTLLRRPVERESRVAADLLEKFQGEVPRDLESLTQLFGVGRKTASVVLGAAFRVPALAVDTHVDRVAQRLGFTRETKDREKMETDLRALFREKDW